MWVLHRNKDSLMAVLEAFVYDPLLNWRLMDQGGPAVKSKRNKSQPDSSVPSSSSQEQGDILDSVANSLSATVAKKPTVPSSVENMGKCTICFYSWVKYFNRFYCFIILYCNIYFYIQLCRNMVVY